LAAHLPGSFPSVLHDEDEGIAEALRRNAEFEANPSLGMSLEELDQRIESRRSMRLVLHPKVYSDIDETLGYYERVATSEDSESFVIS
jgi:hypothetical protein